MDSMMLKEIGYLQVVCFMSEKDTVGVQERDFMIQKEIGYLQELGFMMVKDTSAHMKIYV